MIAVKLFWQQVVVPKVTFSFLLERLLERSAGTLGKNGIDDFVVLFDNALQNFGIAFVKLMFIEQSSPDYRNHMINVKVQRFNVVDDALDLILWHPIAL